MSHTLTRLEAFFAQWQERLCGDRAEVHFAARALDAPPLLHSACADSFVTSLGYQAIGGNWELLDAEAAPDEPRSAVAALGEAFASDMALPQQKWLGDEAAREMAAEFLACFAPATRQIVTNRMYFGWNPITTASIEWAFVAFDDQAIALLLATAEG